MLDQQVKECLHEFGALAVVPVAVLSGVKSYKLMDAQVCGLTLSLAHDLGWLLDWIGVERPAWDFVG